jgi:hypothetical protein
MGLDDRGIEFASVQFTYRDFSGTASAADDQISCFFTHTDSLSGLDSSAPRSVGGAGVA